MNIKARLAEAFALNGMVWLPLLIGLVGLMFCAGAAYLAMATLWGGIAGALITGVALLLIAWAVAFWVANKISPPPAQTPTVDETDTAPASSTEQALQPLLGDAGADWVNANRGPALVAALTAGVILASSPTARRVITRAVAPTLVRSLTRAVRSISDELG